MSRPAGTAGAAVYPHVVAWLRHVVEMRRPRRVLEQGAGAGQYANSFEPDTYVSIDLPETWYAMQRKPSVFASAAALPFAPGSFDLIFSVAAFDYFPYPGRVLTEVTRVLSSSGLCLVFTYDRTTLERIHANCLALPPNRAVVGHHVFDSRALEAMAKAAGLRCAELPPFPKLKLTARLRNLVRPTFHRVYSLQRAA